MLELKNRAAQFNFPRQTCRVRKAQPKSSSPHVFSHVAPAWAHNKNAASGSAAFYVTRNVNTAAHRWNQPFVQRYIHRTSPRREPGEWIKSSSEDVGKRLRSWDP